jgi:hypothetical protein
LSTAHWWWFWKYMMPSLPKHASPEKSTVKRNGGSAHKPPTQSLSRWRFGRLETLDSMYGMGTAAAHAMLSRRSFAQQLTLSLFV